MENSAVQEAPPIASQPQSTKRKTAEEIDWTGVGIRVTNLRKLYAMNREEFADKCGIPASFVGSFEGGRSRKTFGPIFVICEAFNVSPKWMLLGEGEVWAKTDVGEIVDQLSLGKGVGRRRDPLRKEAEEGRFTDEMMEFVLAVDEFKRKNRRPFPSISEIYQLINHLGYRRVAGRSAHLLGF